MSYDDKPRVLNSNPLPLGYDPMQRIRRLFHEDPNTGDVTVQTQQDVQGILATAAEARKSGNKRFRDGLNHLAYIPITVWQDLERRGITRDSRKLLKWLDQSDNKVFRTNDRRVS